MSKKPSKNLKFGKQLAALTAPSEALQKMRATVNRYEEANKAHLSAASIASALSHNTAPSDLFKNPAFPLPKVNLNLPDITRTIQASLPQPLQKPYLPPPDKGVALDTDLAIAADNDVATDASSAVEINASEDLGSLIRSAREKHRLSQQSFADLAGVGRRFVSELENGKPTLEFGKVLKVMRAAGITIFAKPL